MKQLKFMLAAATAVGLSVAAQADQLGNEDFESHFNVKDEVPYPDKPFGFSYLSDDGQNHSVVFQDSNDAKNKTPVLKVDTGTNPLLYNLMGGTEEGETAIGNVDLSSDDVKSVLIETDVKFTVTPAGDTVSDTTGDKLMIYLKETLDETDETKSYTNLVVVASQVEETGGSDDFAEGSGERVLTKKAVTISNVSVTPGVWYKLCVTAKDVDGVPVFNIKIGGNELDAGVELWQGQGTKAFPSLVKSSTLQYVGFAGEGYVDNIKITTESPEPTTVDFTFAWTTAGISAVTYTIGQNSGTVTSGTPITKLDPSATITIQIEPADWYAVKDNADLTYTASEKSANLDNLVTKLASVTTDANGNETVVVESTTTPAALNIKTGSFASEAAGSEELAKAVKWATSKGGATAATIGTVVGALNFDDGNEETDAEKAYLFNCSVSDVADEVANFKFPAFTPGTKPSVNSPLHGGNYNGQLKYYGADTLEGLAEKVEATDAHKFFKAVLTK